MTTIATPIAKSWNWRNITFTILAVLFGLQSFFIGIIIIAPSPWRDPATLPEAVTPWHSSGSAMAVGLLSGVLLLIGAWHPQRKPVLFQIYGFSLLWNIVIALLRIPQLGFDLMGWIFTALAVLILVLYPKPRELFSLTGNGPLSKPLLVVTLAISVLLLWDAGRNLQWQWIGIAGEQTKRFFWLQAALFNTTLAIAGGLTALKRPGWQVLGVLLGLTYVYRGIVALTIPVTFESWGTLGGAVAVLAGIGYCAVTVWEARRLPIVTGAEAG